MNFSENEGHSALMSAAVHGDADCVNDYIAMGADLDEVDDYGNTALHWAVFGNDTDCIKLLLMAGADIAAINKYGETVFDVAEYQEIREMLLAAAVNRDAGEIESVMCEGATKPKKTL